MWFYFIKTFFSTAWVEAEDTYSLSAVSTLQEAVNTILKFLALGSANMSDKVGEGVHTHTLLCSGESFFYFLFYVGRNFAHIFLNFNF